ncbi:HPP family protein [Dehalogenimonas sp. THU2]|uniref:HPP family protein n=1 Tax=Dehalogenimonas sp. THU2 TaxID=3151121 RepID=UPI0032181151
MRTGLRGFELMELIDPHFKKNPRPYIIQSLLGLGVFFLVLLLVERMTQVVIVAALGASGFIVFSMPHSITARPRRLIGGHAVGLVSGTACHLLFSGQLTGLIEGSTLVTAFGLAVTFALAMFLMAATNTEHPPAAATSIGLFIAGWSWGTILFVLLFAVLLAVIHYLLRRYLVDLF